MNLSTPVMARGRPRHLQVTRTGGREGARWKINPHTRFHPTDTRRSFANLRGRCDQPAIMWLLVVQGLLVNAYVPVRNTPEAANGACIAGILITLSAFASLYKSYQARGYLKFLRHECKEGKLPDEYLRFDGWPVERLHGWRSNVWICPWCERFSDLLEPYLTLPIFLTTTRLFFRLKR